MTLAYHKFKHEKVGASFSDNQVSGNGRVPVVFCMMIPHVDILGKSRKLGFNFRNDFHSDVMEEKVEKRG
jgi:hypothetical protein